MHNENSESNALGSEFFFALSKGARDWYNLFR